MILDDLCFHPSGQVLMTSTNGRSRLTNYSVINVSLIRRTVDVRLCKKSIKGRTVTMCQMKGLYCLNKIKAVTALHFLYCTFISDPQVGVWAVLIPPAFCITRLPLYLPLLLCRWQNCLLYFPQVWVLWREHRVLERLRRFQDPDVAQRAGIQGQHHLWGLH